MRFAIIDLGTNSVKLFIYRKSKNQAPQRIFKSKAMVRLGDDLFSSGRLSADAVERTIRAFDRFGKFIKKHKATRVKAIATSALREARKRTRITTPVKKRTGIKIEVISGKREASLIARGVRECLDLHSQSHLLIDIGGGSTEISIIDQGRLKFSVSLQLGAARNQQLYLCQVPPVKRVRGKGVLALRRHIRRVLKKSIPKTKYMSIKNVIGTSGSIRAYRRIAFHNGYHGHDFPVSYLRTLIRDLQSMSRNEILQLPSLESKRADLILSAGIILDEICRHFKCRRIQATSVALKDGVLAEMKFRTPTKKAS